MGRKEDLREIRLLHEQLERKKLTYSPNPKQLLMHKSLSQKIFLQAGNQSGKSFSVAFEIAWRVLEMHNYKKLPKSRTKLCWVVGESKGHVNEYIWELYLRKIIPKRYITREKKNSGYTEKIVLSTGWEIHFKSYDQGREALAGAPVDLIWINEQPSLECYDELEERVSTTGGTIIMDFTPLKFDRPLKEYITKNKDFQIIRMSKFDNPIIDNDELREKMKNWTKARIATRVYGEWYAYEGRLISAFSDEEHCVEDFKIPNHWRRCVTIDPASSSDTGVNWVAEDPNTGKWYVYREALIGGEAASTIIIEILKLMNYKVSVVDNESYSVIPSEEIIDFWYYDQQATYFAKEAAKFKIGMIGVSKKGENENMVNELNQGFMDAEILVFNSCLHTITQLINYINNPSANGEFKPIKQEDHLVDDLKYFWRGRPRFNPKNKVYTDIQKYINSFRNKSDANCHDDNLGYI